MPLTLTPDQVAFLHGPLSMNVGAVGRDGWPCVTRAQGIVVARDRRSLTVLLSAVRSQAVLDALAAGKTPKPGTQLKGRHTVEPIGGPTTLKAMVKANHDYRKEW